MTASQARVPYSHRRCVCVCVRVPVFVFAAGLWVINCVCVATVAAAAAVRFCATMAWCPLQNVRDALEPCDPAWPNVFTFRTI